MGTFLIVHGLGGSGPEHWQTWLARRLREQGHAVGYPDLPDPDAPDLDGWLGALRDAIVALPEPPVVLAHSLGCVLWLHHVAAAAEADGAARTLLVAPPSERSGVAELAPFFPLPEPLPALPGARLVHGDDDPYCPEGAAARYAALRLDGADLLPGAAHVNPDAGFGPWPAAEAWALGQRDSVAGSGAKNGAET